MNIFEALKALDEGKAIKQDSKSEVYYAVPISHFPGATLIDCCDVKDYDAFDSSELYFGRWCSFTRQQIEATDWIVYERPKDLPA